MGIIRKALQTLAPVMLAGLSLVGMLTMARSTQASPAPLIQPKFDGWVVTAVFSDSALVVVDTKDHTVYGPFLAGELGDPGVLLDVVVTPDGKTALVSNFLAGAVYYVDVTDPIHPSLITSVTVPMRPEDIALTKDGRYALVTDGGFSNMVASLDVISPSLVYTTNAGIKNAQAVAVAPDGTAVVADAYDNWLEVFTIDSAGALSHTQTYTELQPGPSAMPINVGIAPDGQTVLVSYFFTDVVGVYQIVAPGMISGIDLITGLPGDQQSLVFNSAGDQVIVSSLATTPTDQVSTLDLLGPGQVSLNTAGIADLKSNFAGGLFGVDVMAVAGDKLYVGNGNTFEAGKYLTVVDLNSWGVTDIPLNDYPAGVAVIPPRRLFLPYIGNQ